MTAFDRPFTDVRDIGVQLQGAVALPDPLAISRVEVRLTPRLRPSGLRADVPRDHAALRFFRRVPRYWGSPGFRSFTGM